VAHVPGPAVEGAVQVLVGNGHAVGDVVADGADAEDGGHGRVTAEPDQADENAQASAEPDGSNRCLGAPRGAAPDLRKRQHLVAREGEHHARSGLLRCHADKVHDDKRRRHEENSAGRAHDVVDQLGDLCDVPRAVSNFSEP
jgi:hypothetical protein